ncbi:TPA: hypothetical protein N0F65_009360 [Lagenidium giganteum]|uniref:Oxidation resistance protein 1 n=1 Tax=Lagenidium giganteum TaxID=4803 RepID=A0AAV2ZAL2_9STRA|nr:TPA: hypothetical protein N0F65_009360 [Lagenidium giganteum]
MLGKITSWIATRLEDKEDDHLKRRFDALTHLKKASLDVLALYTLRALPEDTQEKKDNDVSNAADTTAAVAECAAPIATKNEVVLTEDDLVVHDLCTALEQCLRLGLRHQNDSDVSWWNVLYSSSLVVDEPSLVEAVQTSALLSESDAGKARCWLKTALNNSTLESTLMIIFSITCEQVVWSSYEDWALVRCAEVLELFLQMVVDIRSVRFCIQINDDPFRLSETKEVPMIPIVADATDGNNKPGATNGTEAAAEPQPGPPSVERPSSVSDPVTPLTPDEDFVEVSSMIFPHRNKGIKPWQHVFGVSLAYLSKNPYHSRFALIDPVLAVPNIVQDCIDIIVDNPDTLRLFRATVLNVHISQLREFVETHGAVPEDLDPHAAGALLMDFFKNLPEPLLTHDKYDAFVAAGRIKDEEASVRNIACLVHELPVYYKYVLEKLIGLMFYLQLPEHSDTNGLDFVSASTILAPVIAFKAEQAVVLPNGQRRSSHTQHQDLRYAAVGAQVIERMIKHQEVIFKDVRLEVSDALERLETKKEALSSINHLAKMKPQVNFLSDRQQLEEISKAFTQHVEQKANPAAYISGNNSVDNTDAVGANALPPLPAPSSPQPQHEVQQLVLDHSQDDEGSQNEGQSSPEEYSDLPQPPLVDRSAEEIARPSTAPHPTTLSVEELTFENVGLRRQSMMSTAGLRAKGTPTNSFILSVEQLFDEKTLAAWKSHGFNRPTVLSNFDNGGVLLLRSVAYMIKQDSQVLERLYQRALPTARSSYDAGLVSSAICNSLLNMLKLIPLPEQPSINIVALSVEPFWELFNEEAYFFKLFVLVSEIFDQIWSSLHPDEASFTRAFCDTEAKLDELLKKSPSSVEDMRQEWEEMWKRSCEEAEVAEEQAQANSTPGHKFGAPSPPRAGKRPSFTFSPDDYKRKLMATSSILSLEHVAYLDHAMPVTCQLCRWSLLYSTEQHGSSLHTLLILAKNQSPTLLVIKDDHGNIFGGFASDEWHRAQQYYGNGETFLFSFADKRGGESVASNFVKYAWSRRNSYFMLCSEESLVMGGGGSFGLYLDNDLCTGSTGACETFSSRPLVNGQEFVCVHVEVWGFTTSDKQLLSKARTKKSVLD